VIRFVNTSREEDETREEKNSFTILLVSARRPVSPQEMATSDVPYLSVVEPIIDIIKSAKKKGHSINYPFCKTSDLGQC